MNDKTLDFTNIIEINYPEKEDSLFRDSGTLDDTLCVGWGGININTYCRGFKEVADIAASAFLENRIGRDCHIFPIISLYRHYIELRLKSILFNGRQFLNNSSVKKTHQLKELWPDCRKIMEQVWPKEDRKHLDASQALIFELDDRDPDCINYRYPTTKANNPSIVAGEHINMRNLVETMDKLSSFLDGCDIAIEEYPTWHNMDRNSK